MTSAFTSNRPAGRRRGPVAPLGATRPTERPADGQPAENPAAAQEKPLQLVDNSPEPESPAVSPAEAEAATPEPQAATPMAEHEARADSGVEAVGSETDEAAEHEHESEAMPEPEPTTQEPVEPVEPEPEPARAAQPEVVSTAQPAAPVDTPKKSTRPRKTTASGETSVGKQLVVIRDGKVTHAADGVHVVDLDAAAATANAHEILDAITNLKTAVVDGDVRDDVVEALFTVLRAKV
ncbi:hypothetical protein Br6_04889 [Rhodococcus sp. Br-6]|nr:hypothetical protein Br6_04889 [Rhodococcus sp. Br-6]